jgi:hypothetical protein
MGDNDMSRRKSALSAEEARSRQSADQIIDALPLLLPEDYNRVCSAFLRRLPGEDQAARAAVAFANLDTAICAALDDSTAATRAAVAASCRALEANLNGFMSAPLRSAPELAVYEAIAVGMVRLVQSIQRQLCRRTTRSRTIDAEAKRLREQGLKDEVAAKRLKISVDTLRKRRQRAKQRGDKTATSPTRTTDLS